MKTCPKPDRSNFTPNQVKSPENDTLDIGWNEGTLSDGRPYRMECWAQDGLTSVTFFFSSIEISGGDEEWWAEFLKKENLVTFIGEHFIGASHFIDPSGNKMWTINVVVGDEDQTYVSQTPAVKPYPISGAMDKTVSNSKYGNKESRIGPFFFDISKVTPEEMANAVFSEFQREHEFFQSQLRVDLYKKKLKQISIFIEAYIDPKSKNLVIHGQDLGPKVEEYFGKSDYEYWRTVPCHAKEKVLNILKTMTPNQRLKRLVTMYKHPDIVLVRLVKEHFSKDTAVSSFDEWCSEQGIPCDSYSC